MLDFCSSYPNILLTIARIVLQLFYSHIYLVRMYYADITEELFYFVDVQTLCKTPDDKYLPVEIAVIEYSLKDGITKVYHEFLKPGDIPTGLRYECMSHSE